MTGCLAECSSIRGSTFGVRDTSTVHCRVSATAMGNQSTAVKTMFSMSLGILVFLAPLQAVIGDVHGLNTLEHVVDYEG